MSEAGPLGRSRVGRPIVVILAALVVFTALAVWCGFRARQYPVAQLARTAPRRTALMNQRIAEAARSGRTLEIDQRWVPYERVSPLLRRAVLVAEDDAF